MIYFAFVHFYLLYGIEVYGNTTFNHLSKLIVLNNKLLRILQHKQIKTNLFELYKTYFTLPLHLLHNFQVLVFMHTYVYHRNKLSSVFSTYFEENKLVHHYHTRQRDDFHSHSVRTEKGKRNIKFKGTRFWNSLPIDFKHTVSTTSYRNKLKHYLLQSI